jgi:hypothetical protein
VDLVLVDDDFDDEILVSMTYDSEMIVTVTMIVTVNEGQ